MNAERIVPLLSRAVLRLQGKDVRAFLQKLLTQDIMKLSPFSALYSALLTTQGRYFSDFFMVERDDAIYLDVPKSHLFDLSGQLERYRMRMDVTLEDMSRSLYVFAIIGQETIWQKFDLVPLAGVCKPVGHSFAYVDPRLQSLGIRLIADAQTTLPIQEILRGTEDDYQFLRTRLGVSEAPYDLVQGQSIILEHGFHELNGISWDKGCYPGQELMARTFYRGQLNKRAFPVMIEGTPPDPETQLRYKDQPAGSMLSNCGMIGMALLRVAIAKQSGAQHTSLFIDRSRLQPYVPSWMTLGLEK